MLIPTILAQSTPSGLKVRKPDLELLLGALPEKARNSAELASPVAHVGPGDPPLILLHGDQDPQMPLNQSHQLRVAYEKAGLEVVFIVVHGAAHGGASFLSPNTSTASWLSSREPSESNHSLPGCGAIKFYGFISSAVRS